jgi:hypothetical protein
MFAYDWSVEIAPGPVPASHATGALGRTGCYPCARRHLIDALLDLPAAVCAFGRIGRVEVHGDFRRALAVALHQRGGQVEWVTEQPDTGAGCGAAT